MQAFSQQQLAQEQLRQQYLAAIGVTSWLPTRVLPGAAPSPEWAWQDHSQPDTQPQRSVEAEAVAPAPAARPRNGAPLRQMLQTAEPELKTAEPPLEQPSAPATPAEATQVAPPTGSATVPQFRLTLVSYNDCLVITELPLNQNWSELHQQLLDRIVAAVGLGLSRLGWHEFHWPMDPRANFDQSEPVARRALAMELNRLSQPEQTTWLLMGSQAAQFSQEWEQTPALGELVQQPERRILHCQGLNEVLRVPGMKAELWCQLQPLRTPKRET